MKKSILILVISTLILGACEQSPPANQDVTTGEITITKSNRGEYATIVPQPTSAIRGITLNPEENNLDLEEMEVDLMEISKNYIDTSKNIYIPGQVITLDEAEMLLNRQLTDNQLKKKQEKEPNYLNIGINPKLEDGAEEKSSKTYATTIIEQDYGLYSQEKFTQKAIAIGIGIDGTYEYKDEEGKDKVVEIEKDELINYATKELGSNIIKYVKEVKKLEDIDIIIGYFLQSEDELVPGKYIAHTYIEASEDTVTEINQLDKEVILFPSETGRETDKALNDQFQTINRKVVGYFTDYAGFTAYGTYENEELVKVEFIVNVNFYSKIDVVPFTDYLKTEIVNTLNVSAPVEVKIQSPSGGAKALILIDEKGSTQEYIY